MSARNVKTPNTKKELEKIKSARKGYKRNVDLRRKFSIAGEEALAKDSVAILKLMNYTPKQISMIVGVSKSQVKEYLEDPKIQKKILALRESLPKAALELGHMYLIEALQAIVDVMRRSSNDKMVLAAAAEIFDRFGVPKISRTEKLASDPVGEHGSSASSNEIYDLLRTASPEVQEKAADLQAMMEEGLKELLVTKEKPDA